MATDKIDTHHLTIEFGRYKGELWTRVPFNYLKWLANELDPSNRNKAIALAEIERRGTSLENQEMELSGHALDRASLRCRKVWHETAEEGEGLYSWLMRIATAAYQEATDQVDGSKVAKCLGLKLVFKVGDYYPVLKTVMPYKGGKNGA